MYTKEINKCLKKVKTFVGAYPRDFIPKPKKKEYSVIVNTDDSKNRGTHWVAIFIKDNVGEYFDPFGIPPLYEDFIKFMNDNCLYWSYNTTPIQSLTSLMCGEFCVEFIRQRCAGLPFEIFIALFYKDLRMNDQVIKSVHFISCPHRLQNVS